MMRREYPEQPVPAVGAVVLDGDSVLLVQRDRDPGRGEWSLPGGAVELGESLEAAVKREVWEETSVRIEVGGLLAVLDRIFRDPGGEVRYHYVLVDYWGWVVSGDPKFLSDIRALQWVPVEEMDKLGVRTDLKEIVHRALSMREQERRAGG